MSDASAMARRMSYRKPVPIYVPSPPNSPHSPAKELDDRDFVVEEEVPPVCLPLASSAVIDDLTRFQLPDNWREIISAKIQEVNSSKLSLYAGQNDVPDSATKVCCAVFSS